MSQKPTIDQMLAQKEREEAIRAMTKFFLIFFGAKVALWFILRAIVGATSEDE